MDNYSQLLEQSKQLRLEATKLINAKASVDETQKTNIVAWGLLNVGKSSLLNMLTQHINHDYFKVNDHRETTKVSKFEDEYCIYLDTPGLDANKQDTQEAIKGVGKADVVLFVHQLQGELEKIEIDFLKDLKDSFGKYADTNIIIVLTKIDKEEAQKVDQIEQRILEQCKSLGFRPNIAKVSNTRYKKGMAEHKDVLIEKSHISELQQLIGQAITSAMQAREQRAQEKLKTQKIELITLLEKQAKLLDEAEDILFDKSYDTCDIVFELQAQMQDLFGIVEQKMKQYDLIMIS